MSEGKKLSRWRGLWPIIAGLLVVLVGAALFSACTNTQQSTDNKQGTGQSGQSAQSTQSSKGTSSGKPSSGKASEKAKDSSGLPTVTVDQLPQEARDTLALIAKGGPFPYDRDGITFGNYEKVLPSKSGSYYKEYTVKTPGAKDRGARRIVVGDQSEKYYTDDHYKSFKVIQE